MKRADPSQGFALCFLANLGLHFWWGLAWLVLTILHFWLDTPLYLAWIASAIWVVESLILTAIAYWANKSSQERDPVRENKNPYSAKSKDLFPGTQSQAADQKAEEESRR